MTNTTTLNAPSSDVDNLMREVADEAGIELSSNLPSGVTSTIAAPSASLPAEQELSDRLARLRQS